MAHMLGVEGGLYEEGKTCFADEGLTSVNLLVVDCEVGVSQN